MDASLLVAAPTAAAVSLAAILGADPGAPVEVITAPLLESSDCITLVQWLDAEFAASPQADVDLRRTITPSALSAFIGHDALLRLEAAFAAPYDTIKVRRVSAVGCAVAFHTDTHSVRTMHVALNNDTEYEGGRLVCVTKAGFEIAERPLGTATIHSHRFSPIFGFLCVLQQLAFPLKTASIFLPR